MLAAVFVTVQTLAVAHAAEHSDHPHEHDGVVCDIVQIAADIDPLIPPTSMAAHRVIYNSAARPVIFTVQRIAIYDNRAPPGRAPPA